MLVRGTHPEGWHELLVKWNKYGRGTSHSPVSWKGGVAAQQSVEVRGSLGAGLMKGATRSEKRVASTFAGAYHRELRCRIRLRRASQTRLVAAGDPSHTAASRPLGQRRALSCMDVQRVLGRGHPPPITHPALHREGGHMTARRHASNAGSEG